MLKNEGAKSDLVFIQTKESGKLRKGQHYGNLQKKKKHSECFESILFLAAMVVLLTVQYFQTN